ncbi:MAG: RNA-binding S4 domain-containing protein [Eubacteriaceae bacterium]|nr:RNA-binding S4 domain-containing protein [Eubacteriaceae bacterium]
MRLDKFLKNSRLIKRRTLAKEACDKGKIMVNGVIAKAGTVVKSGDELTITLGPKSVTVVVDQLLEHAPKDEAQNMYQYKEQP